MLRDTLQNDRLEWVDTGESFVRSTRGHFVSGPFSLHFHFIRNGESATKVRQ